jgi:hypothetical protein
MREFYVPEVDESLYGTWVNPAYQPPGPAAKLIIYPWGLVEVFEGVTDTVFSRTGTSIIVDRWTDQAGNIWYKEYRRNSRKEINDGSAFVLARISSNEEVLEFVSGVEGWPNLSNLDPDLSPTYVIYRRFD